MQRADALGLVEVSVFIADGRGAVADDRDTEPGFAQFAIFHRDSSVQASGPPGSLWLPGVGWGKSGNQAAVRAVPNAQDPVLPAGHDDFPVGSYSGGFDELIRAGKGTDVASIFAHQADLAVSRRGQRLVGIADETDGSHLLVETGDVFPFFAIHEIPNLNHVVRSGAGQSPLVAVPTDAQHVVRVAFELSHHL